MSHANAPTPYPFENVMADIKFAKRRERLDSFTRAAMQVLLAKAIERGACVGLNWKADLAVEAAAIGRAQLDALEAADDVHRL